MEELKERVANLIEKLDIDNKRQKIRKLEADATSPSFWQDHQSAAVKMKELYALQKEILDSEKLQELIREGKKEEAEKLLKETEIFLYLSGPYDSGDAILYLHSGQGGVEAMDWTQMLYRMYTRYFERKGFSFETIEENIGEEAGLKSVVVTVSGQYVYGFLKHEAGVHRLVRQSPFNADNLRQTSFALVEVLPDIGEDGKLEIKEDDLNWEFYRASSHGGQNVQKVSSAVRLKHIPSGIVVTAQSERYQGKNREYALKILKAKLWIKQDEERRKQEMELKGGYKTPGWGNQIRSYVLHPYQMVKDLRTEYETGNTGAVLDGDLDSFIDAELRKL
ncbi:MAG: peptide chain release factor 2 [Candidatus Levybacteria bacterium CG_4_10_14_0_2_um_filter_35_8]|nr:MAG: peptide chain release factor 2 [Candidatus Levybacteria bacterium CG_4_10_14_0_2_um_filter_35_8]